MTVYLNCFWYIAIFGTIKIWLMLKWIVRNRTSWSFEGVFLQKTKSYGNCTRMLRAILNNSWRQHPTKQQLYGHVPLIIKTIQVRWNKHAGHSCRSRDEFISDELLWTSSQGWAEAGRLARTYIQQLCVDTGCSPKDLPEVMNDRECFGFSISQTIQRRCAKHCWRIWAQIISTVLKWTLKHGSTRGIRVIIVGKGQGGRSSNSKWIRLI